MGLTTISVMAEDLAEFVKVKAQVGGERKKVVRNWELFKEILEEYKTKRGV